MIISIARQFLSNLSVNHREKSKKENSWNSNKN